MSLRLLRFIAPIVFCVAAAPGTASAFPTYSRVSKACHESITMRALRSARDERPAASPLPPVTRDDRALIDDLPFDVDPDMEDLGAVALLNGVRYNDLHGRGPNEVDELAQIHGDETRQPEHCLRSKGDDEPAGSESALRQCRSFIREKIRDALTGLDAKGAPDVANRVPLEIDLSLRGGVEAPLPRFYARMGEALHAVQDGFTHTYRAGDRTKVTVVLNYIEPVEGEDMQDRDGPGHSSELDRCDADDPMRVRNVELATQATLELLMATLDAAKTNEQKLTEVDVVLDRYFTFQPGCTAANRWCNAPEQDLEASSRCGCSVVGATRGGAWVLGALGIAATLVVARRRRRLAASIAVAAIASLVPGIARAQDENEKPPEQPAPAAPPIEPTPTQKQKQAVEAKKEEEHQTLLGLYAAGAASISNPGGAGVAGLRLRLGDRWALGLDGEWNAWYGIHSGRLRTGAINVYASVIARFPLRFESLNLRSTLQAGTATQVVDLFGAPSGTTGIFLGLNPLGVEWKISGPLYVIFYPLGVALPITQLKGAPFAYPQYRTTLGLELSL